MTQDEINAVKKAAEKMRNQQSAQDEIIEMWNSVIKYAPSEVRITEFAHLVAAKEKKKWQDQTVVEIHEAVLEEREACAKIAEKQRYAMFISLTSHPAQNGTAVGIANAIRARGEA
jgi:hypothetical protein